MASGSPSATSISAASTRWPLDRRLKGLDHLQPFTGLLGRHREAHPTSCFASNCPTNRVRDGGEQIDAAQSEVTPRLIAAQVREADVRHLVWAAMTQRHNMLERWERRPADRWAAAANIHLLSGTMATARPALS